MWFNNIAGAFILICFSRVQAIVTDEDYASIPPVFHLDDFDNCLSYGEKALYCVATIQLSPVNPSNTSKVWNIINELIIDSRNYRHDKLRHGYCIHLACPELAENITAYQNDNTLLKRDLAECMNRKYSDMGLKSIITDTLRCQTIHEIPKDAYDYAGGAFFILIFGLLVWGTLYEGLARYKSKEEYDRIISTKFGKISCFSIRKNWEKLKTISTRPDSKSLRAFNGIRFYNSMVVIIAHTAVLCISGPALNTHFVEQIPKRVDIIIMVHGYYIIQSFFVISGWLLCYQFFLMGEEKEIKFSYIILSFVNRYIRLTPAYLATIVFETTWLRHLTKGPMSYKSVGYETENCRNNWWTNLLYINNFYNSRHMCLQHSWYLSTDTQLFLVSTCILILIWKCKRFIKFILGTCLAISVIVPALITYIFDYDILLRVNPESVYTIFLDKMDFHVMYASPFVNFGGYIIGMIFGYIFYNYRNKIVFTEKWHVVLWWILAFGLQITIVFLGIPIYLSVEKPHIIVCALFEGIAKVTFALGIAIAIFGVSQNIGWLFRTCLIWQPIQILGRLTYCIYLVHPSIIRIRGTMIRSPTYNTLTTLMFQSVAFYGCSLIFAVILCLAVEMPISALQKSFLPQRENKKSGYNSSNNVKVAIITDVVINNKEDKLTPM